MIERGGGRTSGLTDWRLMDLLSMWACIRDHDTAGHWKQVAGWRKVCDLAQTHLGRLKEYRRGLAEAWPPATNAAARAYLGELDDLIDKVQRTHDAAAANYDALAAATRAISSARVKLKPLHDEYVDKLQQKRTFEATLADPKAAMGSRVPDEPVTDAELERINSRARTVMYGISGELQQAQAMLRQPPAPRPRIDDGEPADLGDDTPPTPAIPPVIPAPTRLAGSTSMRRANSGADPVEVPMSHRVGPILGGANIDLTAPRHIPAYPEINNTHQANSLSPKPPEIPPPSTGMGMGKNLLTPPPRSSIGPAARPSGESNSTPRAPFPNSTPTSGIIGGTPSSGFGKPGANTSPRRVNPVGGVIGGGGVGTAPSGATGSRPIQSRAGQGNVPNVLHPANSAITRNNKPSHSTNLDGDYDKADEWDPDHPWETRQGVAPVVRPPSETGPIDPGPAIGFVR
ncbi:hypothetical protein [Micromonospora sp. DT233]|uniref:hypothetical protein n=1 Tax=Micromonospora sp. DT233 TaxID=3393432 RepID=UPI003CEFD57D